MQLSHLLVLLFSLIITTEASCPIQPEMNADEGLITTNKDSYDYVLLSNDEGNGENASVDEEINVENLETSEIAKPLVYVDNFTNTITSLSKDTVDYTPSENQELFTIRETLVSFLNALDMDIEFSKSFAEEYGILREEYAMLKELFFD